MRCPTCGHETDNGLGFCNFCRTPFPPEAEQAEMIEDEPAEAEELAPVKRGRGRL